MYAAIIECDMRALASSHERGRVGRALATRLGALPGFVAFVALDADAEAEAGKVAALCIFEDRAALAAGRERIAAWHAESFSATGAALREIGAGAVIAQKGL